MKDLILRLEKATGPDREIDLAIGHWLWRITNAGKPWECFDYGTDGPNRKFTNSIDAALTLVPEGHVVSIRSYSDGSWRASVRNLSDVAGQSMLGGEKPIAAIALCIAALKARLAMAEKG